jgi:hypothetical protein
VVLRFDSIPVQPGDNPDAGDASKNKLEQDASAAGINIRMSIRDKEAAENQHTARRSNCQPFQHNASPTLIKMNGVHTSGISLVRK